MLPEMSFPMLAVGRTIETLRGAEQSVESNTTGMFAAHVPAQTDLLDYCHSVAPGFAVLLILMGIVYLLFGFNIFKILVTLNAALLGGYVGAMIGERGQCELPAGIVGGIIAATAAWPTMKYSVAIMGSLFGAVLGLSFWRLANLDPNFGWSGAMTGTVFCGLMSLLLFRQCIMTYTSLQGSAMLVFGILALIFKYEQFDGTVMHSLQIKPFLLPMFIFIPTLVGYIFQQSGSTPGAAAAAPAKK